MQLAEQGYYDKRAFYYWAKVHSDQIETGDSTVKKGIEKLYIMSLDEEKREIKE